MEEEREEEEIESVDASLQWREDEVVIGDLPPWYLESCLVLKEEMRGMQ